MSAAIMRQSPSGGSGSAGLDPGNVLPDRTDDTNAGADRSRENARSAPAEDTADYGAAVSRFRGAYWIMIA
jgi:hypothetical protein